MQAVFISANNDGQDWLDIMQQKMPELELAIWPDVPNPDQIEAALVWKPPLGVLAQFKNLRLICSLGMGVDFLFADPDLPQVPIARLIDPDMIAQMSEYVCAVVLWRHRLFDTYRNYQRQEKWQPLPPPKTAACKIGILGLGTIGSDIANKLNMLGFSVHGWSRTCKQLDNIQGFAGADELGDFLAQSQILVCVLPLTDQTREIINHATLAQLPHGAYVINIARGGHVDEPDLLAAIDRGHIAGAALDVYQTEPLPDGHPFWSHPEILMTPHIAGLTRAETAAAQVVANLRRLASGQPLRHIVDSIQQY